MGARKLQTRETEGSPWLFSQGRLKATTVSGESGALAHTALWDLALWAPLFLIWGLLWAGTARTYARRGRTTNERPR